MRKVILHMMITLDGFVAGPNNELDWIMMDSEKDKDSLDFYNTTVDTGLMGYGAYRTLFEFWPNVLKDPLASELHKAFSKKMEDIRKVVFSGTDRKLEWSNTELFVITGNDDIVKEVAKLKQQPGKDIVLIGGVQLAQTFVQLGLVDEYRLFVHPVILGNGKPLFIDIANRINLKLSSAKTYRSGVMALHYLSLGGR